jgi:hypothetical protein
LNQNRQLSRSRLAPQQAGLMKRWYREAAEIRLLKLRHLGFVLDTHYILWQSMQGRSMRENSRQHEERSLNPAIR